MPPQRRWEEEADHDATRPPQPRSSSGSTTCSTSSWTRSRRPFASRASTRSTPARSTTTSWAARARSRSSSRGVYEALGADVDLWAIEPGRENAVGVIPGQGGGRSLIYNGHVDVVPPGDPAKWKSGDPFSGRIDGDRVWGRGSTDMKAGILAQAYRGARARRVRRQAQGRPDPRGGRGRGGHGSRVRRDRDGQARLHGRRCGRLGAQRAAGAARRDPRLPRPAVVLGDRAGQGHPRLHARPHDARGRRHEHRRERDRQGRLHLPGAAAARGRVGPHEAAPAVQPRALHAPPRRRHGRALRRARAVRDLRVHDDRVLRLVPPGRGPGGRQARDRDARRRAPRAWTCGCASTRRWSSGR